MNSSRDPDSMPDRPDPRASLTTEPSVVSRRAFVGAGAIAVGAVGARAVLGQQPHEHASTPAQPSSAPPAQATTPTPARSSTQTSDRPVSSSLGNPSVDAEGRPYSATHFDRPGEPGREYIPVVVPNGWTLPYRVVDGVKVFHLVAEEVRFHEFAPGLTAHSWGFNGSVHGPVIEAVEGDRIRVYVTNRLPAATSIHWHALLLPNGMDGVGGLTQPVIPPGATFVYEFTLLQHGTFMYHSHHDEMTQMALGLTGLVVIHPRVPAGPRPDREFALMLHEWRIDAGTYRPFPMEMTDFNVLTINAKVFPATEPLVARRGQRVRLRIGNLSATDHHPMHLHGHHFWVVATDGGTIPEPARQPQSTVLVPVGSTRDAEFIADAAGDWAFHCHMTHHMMNQMGHGAPNMIGVDTRGLDETARRLLPGYMTMGTTGMAQMGEMSGMPVPDNSIPMRQTPGPFDPMTIGGMFTILKVRNGIDGFDDPGWYQHPPRTVSWLAGRDELSRDGVSTDGSGAPRVRPTGRENSPSGGSPPREPHPSGHEGHKP